MKQILFLIALFAILSAKGQSIRKSDKDSAVKYYRAFFEHIPGVEDPVAGYAKWRSICLSQCKNNVDSFKFIAEMTAYAPKKYRTDTITNPTTKP